MERQVAAQLLRSELDKHSLQEWKIRITSNINQKFLALCSYKDKCIIINAHHVDLHDDKEILNTIRHEIAHALTPNNGHNEVWAAKAKEIGCYDNSPCAHYGLPDSVIDAIRSGADVEVDFDETVIRTPKYKISRVQEKCPYCNSVAIYTKESIVTVNDPNKPDLKVIVLQCKHTVIKPIPKGTPFQLFISDIENKSEIKNCNHKWIKNQCQSCGAYQPFQFQIEGMKHGEVAISTGKGIGIFDEMGLGKTIQALGILKFHPELFPVVFVVKSSITFQWLKQIMIWLGNSHYCQIVQNSNDYLLPQVKGYIISYDMMVFKTRTNKNGKTITQGFDINKFTERNVKTVVLDECQQIKNPDSSRTGRIRELCKDRKVIALSGTPWKNRGNEFFSALNLLDPYKFHSYNQFIKNWVHMDAFNKMGGIKYPDRFKEYIKDIVIRRERTEVMKELPLVNRMRLYIQLDQLQQDEYDNEVSDFVKWYNEKVIGGEEEEISGIHILAKMSRMRHITGLAKIPATIEFCKDFAEETDRKLCIFVHHKDVGDIIYNRIKQEIPDIPVLKITGDMDSLERFQIAEEFNRLPRTILVASTLASGEGLNLQTGADCIVHERQWNPANEEQAEGRFIRIGQTASSVNATYPLGEGTIDDMFDEIVENKRNQFHAAMNKGEYINWGQDDIGKLLAEKIISRFRNSSKKKNITNKVKV